MYVIEFPNGSKEFINNIKGPRFKELVKRGAHINELIKGREIIPEGAVQSTLDTLL